MINTVFDNVVGWDNFHINICKNLQNVIDFLLESSFTEWQKHEIGCFLYLSYG